MSETANVPRPQLLTPRLRSVPDTLRALDQWVLWRAEWNADKGKWNKIPIRARDGGPASSTDPTTWATWEQVTAAYTAAPGKWGGIGIVLTADDPLCGIDLDHALDGLDTLPVQPLGMDAQVLMDSIPTYWEMSPSGTGVRGFAIAALPEGGRKRGDIEMYETGRFLTVTGRKWPGALATIEACQSEVSGCHALVWPPQAPREKQAATGAGLAGTDADLLEKAYASRNGDKIRALYSGDTGGYAGPSEADLALCSLVAFWTGPDEARLDGLFRASGLMRDKWDEVHYGGGETYGQHTVRLAISNCTEFYKPGGGGGGRPPFGGGGDTPPGTGSVSTSTPDGRPNYRSSDTGNSERFLDQHSAVLRYDHDAKCWYVWDGQRWNRDGNGRAQEKAKQTVIGIYAEASAEPDEDRRKALATHAKASDKAQRINALLTLACSDPRVSVTAQVWDRDTHLLNCPNGTLDLRAETLKPHDPADLITKLCPVVYDPAALCPLWERCMERWQPDGGIRAFLQRAAGCSLTGDIGEETAFFLYGVGRNGKSKFTSALEDILGDYAARVNIEVLMDSRKSGSATPDLIPLIGARLVIASELPEGRRINEAFLKDVTGGDKLTANPKYANIITFRPQFKLWLYGNHKPTIRGTDDGIWSRLPLVPFTVTIPVEERDPDLSGKLREELPGILAWMVRGCRTWLQTRLAPPEAVIEATQEFREEMDTLTAFWEEHCVFGGEMWTSSSDLRDAYLKWCDAEKTRNPLTAPQFGERLKQRGAVAASQKRAGQKVRGWRGVGIKTAEPEPDFAMSDPEPAAGYAGYAAKPDSANSSHGDALGKVSENAPSPVPPVPPSSNSDTSNAFSDEKKEEIETKPPFGESNSGAVSEDEDPFAEDTGLTERATTIRGEPQIEVALTGAGWAETGTGHTFEDAIDDLRDLINSPSDHEDLAPLKLAALEDALRAREARGQGEAR